MKNFFIKNHSDNGGVYILHVLVNSSYTNFQWYISDTSEEPGTLLEKERYESFTISTEQIKEKGYDGKWVYCTCKHNGKIVVTEKIQLHTSYEDLNTSDFTDISVYDENGMITELKR